MCKSDIYYLDMALQVAAKSTHRQRHGAVVVRHGKVLSTATNIKKNNPMVVNYMHCSVHAEVAALRKAGWPRRVTVYVARMARSGAAAMSRPCDACMATLTQYQCRVRWTI